MVLFLNPAYLNHTFAPAPTFFEKKKNAILFLFVFLRLYLLLLMEILLNYKILVLLRKKFMIQMAFVLFQSELVKMFMKINFIWIAWRVIMNQYYFLIGAPLFSVIHFALFLKIVMMVNIYNWIIVSDTHTHRRSTWGNRVFNFCSFLKPMRPYIFCILLLFSKKY